MTTKTPAREAISLAMVFAELDRSRTGAGTRTSGRTIPDVPMTRPHIMRETTKLGPVWVVYWVPHFPHHVDRTLECVQRLQAKGYPVTVRFGDPR